MTNDTDGPGGTPQERDRVAGTLERRGDPAATASGRPDALPEGFRERYRIQGASFALPDGTPAFDAQRDRIRLRTDNVRAIADALLLTKARGWQAVAVVGTRAIQEKTQTAARQANVVVEKNPTEGRPPRDPDRSEDAGDPPSPRRRAPPRMPGRQPGDVVHGRLVDYGPAPYRFEPDERRSFYIRIETMTGPRDLWGTDLKRALEKSETQPQRGDPVGIQFRGTQTITLRVEDRRPGEKPPKRNQWRVEASSWFEERATTARALREERPLPSQGQPVSQTSIDALVVLKAAQLFADKAISNAKDRNRFEQAIRQTLASAIETGRPVPAIRLREPRQRSTTNPERRSPERTTDDPNKDAPTR